jgi:hypothetical protein
MGGRLVWGRGRGWRGDGNARPLHWCGAQPLALHPKHYSLHTSHPTPRSLLEKTVDLNALFTLAAPIMHLMPDFQAQLKTERQAAGAR